MKYLEMPLGALFKATFIWNCIFGEDGKEIFGLEAALLIKGR